MTLLLFVAHVTREDFAFSLIFLQLDMTLPKISLRSRHEWSGCTPYHVVLLLGPCGRPLPVRKSQPLNDEMKTLTEAFSVVSSSKTSARQPAEIDAVTVTPLLSAIYV